MADFDIDKDIEKWAAATGLAIVEVARASSLDIFTKIVKRTPVDTGRLINNWQLTTGTQASGTIDSDGSLSEAVSNLNAEIPNLSFDKDVYYTNNLPYAEAIENGHSTVKSPQGMVKVTLTEFESAVDKAVRDNKI